LRTFTNSPRANSLPQTTWLVVSGSSLPGNAGNHAAGLTRRDLSSRHVPGSQVAPPIAVETFRRNVKTPEPRRVAAIA